MKREVVRAAAIVVGAAVVALLSNCTPMCNDPKAVIYFCGYGRWPPQTITTHPAFADAGPHEP